MRVVANRPVSAPRIPRERPIYKPLVGPDHRVRGASAECSEDETRLDPYYRRQSLEGSYQCFGICGVGIAVMCLLGFGWWIGSWFWPIVVEALRRISAQ